MRGEASRIADRESRDSLAPKLRDTREDAWRIGNELFTITKVLDDSIQLERALTDPSRPVADKVAVLKELLGDNAHPMTMEIMTDLVSRRWTRWCPWLLGPPAVGAVRATSPTQWKTSAWTP